MVTQDDVNADVARLVRKSHLDKIDQTDHNDLVTTVTDIAALLPSLGMPSGPLDISDRANRLLGIVYGDLAQLLQDVDTHALVVKVDNFPSFPTSIEVSNFPSFPSSIEVSNFPSGSAIDVEQVLGVALSLSNPLLAEIVYSGAAIDPRAIRALTSTDIVTAYGSIDKLQQRATSKELLVQICDAGSEIDPRAIRELTSSDIVTVEQSTYASLKAEIDLEEFLGTAISVLNPILASIVYSGAVIDPRSVSLAVPSTIGTLADVTAAASATRLIADSTPCKSILVRALKANASVIRVGDSNVAANRGAEIAGGDAVTINIDNVNKGYVFGNGTDKVSVTYVN